MIINSKFHDYYDTIIKSAGVDKTIVYNRKEETVLEKSWSLDYSSSIWRNLSTTTKFTVDDVTYSHERRMSKYIIYFCGKKYPFLEFYTSQKDYYDTNGVRRSGKTRYERFFPFHVESDMEFLKENIGKRTLQKLLDFFENIPYPDLDQICLDNKTPILLIYPTAGKIIIDKDINLKERGFAKVKNPWDSFQEISMYFTNELCNVDYKEPLPLTEKEWVGKKGFDKWSFRKKVR